MQYSTEPWSLKGITKTVDRSNIKPGERMIYKKGKDGLGVGYSSACAKGDVVVVSGHTVKKPVGSA